MNDTITSEVSKVEINAFLERRAKNLNLYLEILYTICYCFLPLYEYEEASNEILDLQNVLRPPTT